MNENINLYEILKGREGETFYSPIFGNLTFMGTIYPDIRFKTASGDIWDIKSNGKLYNNSDELCIFPSKNQRDWNKWLNKQKPKIWHDLVISDSQDNYALSKNGDYIADGYDFKSGDYDNIVAPIEKSVLALLKIRQLIDASYGGNITDLEWTIDSIDKYCIIYDSVSKVFRIVRELHNKNLIAFHNYQQATRFLTYKENIDILKEYFIA